jgi:hypothetical protein
LVISYVFASHRNLAQKEHARTQHLSRHLPKCQLGCFIPKAHIS